MATYDSIINVDEWISDHYFTTDETKGESFTKRVKARTKEWAALEQETGTLSPIKRLQQHRGELQTAFATDADRNTTARLIHQAFGYGTPAQQTYTRAGDTFHYTGWLGNAGTLAVIAGGIDIFYPPENEDRQRAIAERILTIGPIAEPLPSPEAVGAFLAGVMLSSSSPKSSKSSAASGR